MYSVCVRGYVCVLSSMSLIIHHFQLSRVQPAQATVGQIQNKLYAKATAPLMPGLRRSPGRQICGIALNCVRLLLCRWRERGHRVCMEIRVAPATLNSYLHVDSFLRGERARMEVVPTKIPTFLSCAAEDFRFCIIAVCLSTVLFLCSADDTYIWDIPMLAKVR